MATRWVMLRWPAHARQARRLLACTKKREDVRIYHDRMSESATSVGRLFGGRHGPPANELPFVLATPQVVWRGDGIAFAVPAWHVYTSGAEAAGFARNKGRAGGSKLLARCRGHYPAGSPDCQAVIAVINDVLSARDEA